MPALPCLSCLSRWLHFQTYDSSAARAEIHPTKDNIRTLMSTNRDAGGMKSQKINVCPEESHFPPSHCNCCSSREEIIGIGTALHVWCYQLHAAQSASCWWTASDCAFNSKTFGNTINVSVTHERLCHGKITGCDTEKRGSAGRARCNKASIVSHCAGALCRLEGSRPEKMEIRRV